MNWNFYSSLQFFQFHRVFLDCILVIRFFLLKKPPPPEISSLFFFAPLFAFAILFCSFTLELAPDETPWQPLPLRVETRRAHTKVPVESAITSLYH